MKPGANNSDKVQIHKLAEEGYSAEDISEKLQIDLTCINAFIKPVKKKSAPKKEKTEPEIIFSD
jgi:hypothetical protein